MQQTPTYSNSPKNAVYVPHYSNHLIRRVTYVTQFQTRELLRQLESSPPAARCPPLAPSPVAAYLTATPPGQPREFMGDWRKAIQGVGSSWYLRAEESTTVMPSQVSALSLTSGNKGKKKAATGRKANCRQRARSIEEDRYNAALELAIEEEKENEMQELAAGEDEDEQFDLAIEGHTSEQFQRDSDGKQMSATPKSRKNVQSSEPATPSKPQKAHVFAPSLILDPPNVRANLKKQQQRVLLRLATFFLQENLSEPTPQIMKCCSKYSKKSKR